MVDVKEIDGHNIKEILDSLKENIQPDKPRAIIVNIIKKGKGFLLLKIITHGIIIF